MTKFRYIHENMQVYVICNLHIQLGMAKNKPSYCCNNFTYTAKQL